MKLELKHIAPYLAHGLKFVTKDSSILELSELKTTSRWKLWANNLTKYNRPYFLRGGMIGKGFIISQIKPLLLPLSALTEPLPDGSIPIVELAKIHLDWVEGSDYNLKCDYIFQRQIHVTSTWNNTGSKDPYFDDSLFIQTVNTNKNMAWINEYLFANHFDIYGLIDAGLSIDKRTIKL